MSNPPDRGPADPGRLDAELLRAWSEEGEDRALFPIDADGRVAGWDAGAARVEGHPASTVLGLSASDLIDEPAGSLSPTLAKAATSGRAELLCWRRRGDGTRFRARVVLTVLRDEAGAPLGFAHMTVDLTAKDRLRRRARRAEKGLAEFGCRKEEFLAMLAHELRNPLAPMLNAAQILHLRGDCPATAARMRAMIEQQVRHMSRLVDDLLDVSRITRGKIRLRLGRVDLGAVLARAIEAARPLMEASGHTLSVSPPGGPLIVEGDETRLEQVLNNLLNNAAKYTDAGGTIGLTAVREGGEAVLRVIDSGIGIAPPMLARVFDLFAQADRSLDRTGGGLGIGLTLVRSLVILHGGTVQARSPGLGRGSEFVVRLPAIVEAPAEPEGPEAPPAACEHTSCVLIVDDNIHAAASLSILVELWGHSPRVAHDGPTALELAEAFRPGVVLLDIGLPGMDGLEVARHLRTRFGRETPLIVAMTGYGRDEDRRRSQEAGFDHHLVKPLDLDLLEVLIARPESAPSLVPAS